MRRVVVAVGPHHRVAPPDGQVGGEVAVGAGAQAGAEGHGHGVDGGAAGAGLAHRLRRGHLALDGVQHGGVLGPAARRCLRRPFHQGRVRREHLHHAGRAGVDHVHVLVEAGAGEGQAIRRRLGRRPGRDAGARYPAAVVDGVRPRRALREPGGAERQVARLGPGDEVLRQRPEAVERHRGDAGEAPLHGVARPDSEDAGIEGVRLDAVFRHVAPGLHLPRLSLGGRRRPARHQRRGRPERRHAEERQGEDGVRGAPSGEPGSGEVRWHRSSSSQAVWVGGGHAVRVVAPLVRRAVPSVAHRACSTLRAGRPGAAAKLPIRPAVHDRAAGPGGKSGARGGPRWPRSPSCATARARRTCGGSSPTGGWTWRTRMPPTAGPTGLVATRASLPPPATSSGNRGRPRGRGRSSTRGHPVRVQMATPNPAQLRSPTRRDRPRVSTRVPILILDFVPAPRGPAAAPGNWRVIGR